MKTRDFACVGPKLAIEDYFNGRIQAWGVFEDRFGAVRRQFTVDIDGSWDGAELVLDERFAFKDGERDRRVWRLRKTGADGWEGRANAVVGTAVGDLAGNAFNFRYDFELVFGGRAWHVRFDDWMFLQDEKVLINRTYVSKWGIGIGQLAMFFHKVG